MAPLEEPSVSELIRDLQGSVEGVAEDVREIRAGQDRYVTRETYDVHREADLRRLTALENSRQQWWTLLAMPVMVGVLVVLIQELIK